MTTASALSLACLAAVAALLVAERQGHAAARAVCKLGASTAFVGTALALGALSTPYGRAILAALVLGWIGDAALLSHRSTAFLAGLGAFLLAHLCFAWAFVGAPLDRGAVGVAAPLALAFGVAITRWLWPHLPSAQKGPVLAYVVAILCMAVAAASYAAATEGWIALAGALLFSASDVAVARDRFVAPGFVNKAWGLPTYFVAQLLMAWSIVA